MSASKEKFIFLLTKKRNVSYNEEKGENIMKKTWNNRWKKALIWLSGYLSFIAFAIVGGFVIVKSEDKELRKTAKSAFIVTLVFTAIAALQTILSNINARAGYKAAFSEFNSWLGFIVTLAEIFVYATFVLLSLFGASSEEDKDAAAADDAKKETPDEAQKSDGEEQK